MKKKSKSKLSDDASTGQISKPDRSEDETPDNHTPDKSMGKDKARLDHIRSKVSGQITQEPESRADTPEADYMALQLQSLIERHKIDRAARSVAKEKAAKKKTKYAEIQKRIDDGFYDDPYQLAELAERLIKRFGLD